MPQHRETTQRNVIVDKVNEVHLWIQKLTEAHEALGNYSICPYAGTAEYSIIQCNLKDICIDDTKTVQIFIVEDDCSIASMMDYRNILNRMYKNYMFLDDHRDEPTYIQGIQSNFGKGNLLICQRRDELLKARNTLHKTEYYSYWSQEMYGRIING
jgi:hypothetical protein